VDNIHAVNDLAKYHMFVVQEWCWGGGDEELAAVGVRARVLSDSVSRVEPGMEKKELTAMLKSPARSCFSEKFSSANLGVP
jgi:hypothetical protein